MNSGKQTLTFYFNISCISYTILSLVLSTLALFDLSMPITPVTMIQLFSSTSMIAFLMYCARKIPNTSVFVEMVVQLVIVFLVVFGLGTTYQWFVWRWDVLLVVCLVIILVYFMTYIAILVQNKKTSDKINCIIQKKRSEEK